MALIGVAGCGDSGTSAVASGETLYLERHADGNTFACASCHALDEPAPDGIRRPGHPIGDAANRPSFKNGQLDALLDAVNSCRVEWMAATAFSDDDARWLALFDVLERSGRGLRGTRAELSNREPADRSRRRRRNGRPSLVQHVLCRLSWGRRRRHRTCTRACWLTSGRRDDRASRQDQRCGQQCRLWRTYRRPNALLGRRPAQR